MTAEAVRVDAEAGRVSPEWLRLRESADAAARSVELADRLARHLPGTGQLAIHDLGGGSGAMGRWLAPLVPGPQHWVVHDLDEHLLELAAADPPSSAADGSAVTVEARRSDITRLEPNDLAGASVVVASALLDILTADELARIFRACAGRPMLLALTVVGRVTLIPREPLDRPIGAAFDAHQRRGGRPGPDAVAAVLRRFRGADVVVRPSPWELGRDDAELQAEWLEGWVAAACEQDPALSEKAREYLDRRLARAAAGELEVIVDHADLLVLP
jgi:hypothetical protein